MEIIIVSNLKSDEIYDLLKDNLENIEDLKLEKRKEPENSKNLDPNIVIAMIYNGVTTLTLLINTIFTIWAAKRKEKEVNIKIKYTDGKTGNAAEVEFPAGFPQEKIDEYLEKIKNKTIKSVTILEK